jgi:hypothetical protein
MSELLQSPKYPVGQHPDADQLNAFVEHALPEHARLETLAHLAECADCREVVALSRPPLEDAAAAVEPIPRPIPQPRFSDRFSGLFSGWNLVWIAAPALAALVVLTVHLRNLPTGPPRAAAPGQVADSHPPAQPAPPQAANPPASKAPLKRKAAPARQAADTAEPRPAVAPSSVETPAISSHDVAHLKSPPPLIVQDRAVQGRIAPAGSSQPAAQAGGGPVPVHGSMAGIAGGAGGAATSPRRPGGTAMGFLRQAPRPALAAAPMATRQVAPQLGPVASQSAPARPMSPTVLNQASVSASGAAPATASDSAAITVNVQSAQIDVPIAGREVYEAPAGLAQAKSAYVQTPLPSGLAVLSLAANLHQRLALDTRNQLFFSEDDGQHWKAVSMPWRAHAKKVATLSAAPHRAAEPALAVPERYTPGASASPEPEYDQGSSSSSLSGAVTDASGAVIPGATVVATDNHTALTRTVQTDAAGRFFVEELPPGVYRLEAHAPGFQKQSQTAALAPSQQTVTNIVLAVGQSSQTVTVQASPPAQLGTISRAMSLGGMKARKAVPSPSLNPPVNRLPPVFVITTDTGDRWTSPDGQTWKPE